jgi:hypothetical protein
MLKRNIKHTLKFKRMKKALQMPAKIIFIFSLLSLIYFGIHGEKTPIIYSLIGVANGFILLAYSFEVFDAKDFSVEAICYTLLYICGNVISMGSENLTFFILFFIGCILFIFVKGKVLLQKIRIWYSD